MSVRVVKECLIAAADLDMIGGDYVFLAFEIDIARGTERQLMTFKWATADYGMFPSEMTKDVMTSKDVFNWEMPISEQRSLTSHSHLCHFFT